MACRAGPDQGPICPSQRGRRRLDGHASGAPNSRRTPPQRDQLRPHRRALRLREDARRASGPAERGRHGRSTIVRRFQ